MIMKARRESQVNGTRRITVIGAYGDFYALTLLTTASVLFAVLVIVEAIFERGFRRRIRTSTHETWVKV